MDLDCLLSLPLIERGNILDDKITGKSPYILKALQIW